MDFEEWMDGIEANDYDDIICAMGDAFEAGQQSKQAEIDKGLSDYQLEVSQVGQSCVKWREIAEGKQAEIDALKSKIQTAINRACMLQNSSGERIYTELKGILK